jgi:hypothetical protein
MVVSAERFADADQFADHQCVAGVQGREGDVEFGLGRFPADVVVAEDRGAADGSQRRVLGSTSSPGRAWPFQDR